MKVGFMECIHMDSLVLVYVTKRLFLITSSALPIKGVNNTNISFGGRSVRISGPPLNFSSAEGYYSHSFQLCTIAKIDDQSCRKEMVNENLFFRDAAVLKGFSGVEERDYSFFSFLTEEESESILESKRCILPPFCQDVVLSVTSADVVFSNSSPNAPMIRISSTFYDVMIRVIFLITAHCKVQTQYYCCFMNL